MTGTWNITKISKECGKVVIEASSDAVRGSAIVEEGQAWDLVKKINPYLSSWHKLCGECVPGKTSNFEDDLRTFLDNAIKKKKN